MNLYFDFNTAGDEFWRIELMFDSSLIGTLMIGDPGLICLPNNDNIDNTLIKDSSGDSFWTLDKIDGQYNVTFEISGQGDNASLSVKLPKDEMDIHMKNIYLLINKSNQCSFAEFYQFAIEYASTMNNINIIVD